MRKLYLGIAVLSFAFSQSAVANMMKESDSCGVIAKACLSAGFVKAESNTKGIWHDCMRPIILGQSVNGVTVDGAVVKTCRTEKIAELKMELQDFEKVN